MKIGVIFGGRSCEHDISVITGVMTANAASTRHDVVPVYIDGDGVWYTGRNFFDVSVFATRKFKKKRVHLRPGSRGVYSHRGRKIARLDAVIICCHGLNGEDGTLAGLLELCGIPYAGSGVLSSAIGMDKIVQKQLYERAGIAVTPFLGVSKSELSGGFFDVVSEVNKSLTFPLIVKPASLGSSIGIGLAHDFKELFLRLDEAFVWDNRVIIESALEDFVEVNCAVLGQGDRLVVSQIEQPLCCGFLSYRDKYGARVCEDCFCDERQDVSEKCSLGECAPSGCRAADSVSDECVMGSGKGCIGRYLPAHISPEMSGRVRETAKKVFGLLGCSGVARIDFLIKGDDLYVNEINTVPGSLSSYLFAFDGIDFPLLIDKLLATAEKKFKEKSRLKYTFSSDVLRGGGGKGGKRK